MGYCRNKVNYEIKKAKTNYYKDCVNDNKSNPKKIWSVLKELGSSNKCITKITNIHVALKIRDKMCFDIIKTRGSNLF